MEVMSVFVNAPMAVLYPVILGVLIFFVGVVTLVVAFDEMDRFSPEAKKTASFCGLVFLVLGLGSTIGGGIIVHRQDNRSLARNIAVATQRLEPYGAQANETKFYLKEMVQKGLLSGEIKSSFGGFLFFAGSIYGRISQEQKLTVVYYDDDSIIDGKIGVYRVATFNLENIDIQTIRDGERPYFKFTTWIAQYTYGGQEKVGLYANMNGPRLYLPEGWQIIGANDRY